MRVRDIRKKILKIFCLSFLILSLLTACAGNTAGDGEVSESQVSSGALAESGVSSGAVRDSKVSAIMKENGKVLEGIPEDTAAQLCCLVRDRRTWLQNNMDYESDGELEQYLDYANYESGLHFSVTDLDQNGVLEILTADVAGSGGFSYNGLCVYDCSTSSVRKGKYKMENGIYSGFSVGGTESVPVYVTKKGRYCYNFADYVAESREEASQCVGVLMLSGDILTEGGCYKAMRAGREIKYWNAWGERGSQPDEVEEQGTAHFGWERGRGALVDMSEGKILEKLVRSWKAFRVDRAVFQKEGEAYEEKIGVEKKKTRAEYDAVDI